MNFDNGVYIHVTTTQSKIQKSSITLVTPQFLPGRTNYILFLTPTYKLAFRIHLNEITQYIFFYIRLLPLYIMFLRFIHIVRGSSSSFHFIVYKNDLSKKLSTVLFPFDRENINKSYKSIPKRQMTQTIMIMKKVAMKFQ